MPPVFAVDEELLFHIDKRENNVKDCASTASTPWLFVVLSSLAAKDNPFQIATWPDSGRPVLRFTFSKFKDIGGMGKEHTYITDTIAENVSDKTIGDREFFTLRL
jgi:hypothetical protein